MLLFVDDLTVIDFSYVCEKRGMVGESWLVDVELLGDLNNQSMVLDFGLVKKQIKTMIDDLVDHKLAVPTQSAKAEVAHLDDAVQLDFWAQAGAIHMTAPAQAYALIDARAIDKASVTAYLEQEINRAMPDNVKKVSLTLRDENINGFYYHYTHGLKKHDGNCQRIAHGHRSKVQIFADSARIPRLEKLWSDRWEDIYLASEEDLVTPQDLRLSDKAKAVVDKDYVCSSYVSQQGRFDLAMRKEVTEVVPCDTTVECLAQYMANQIKVLEPNAEIKVRAFEGVAKGAIAFA